MTPTSIATSLRALIGGWGRKAVPRAESKASSAGPLIALDTLRQPAWTPRDYAAFAREGFMANAIVYRCVRMIAETAASVPLLLYRGEEEIEAHALSEIIGRPNQAQVGPELIETLVGHLLVQYEAGRRRDFFLSPCAAVHVPDSALDDSSQRS